MTIVVDGLLSGLLVTRGLTPRVVVPVTSYPDPFAATATQPANPFAASSSAASDPFAATARYKGN